MSNLPNVPFTHAMTVRFGNDQGERCVIGYGNNRDEAISDAVLKHTGHKILWAIAPGNAGTPSPASPGQAADAVGETFEERAPEGAADSNEASGPISGNRLPSRFQIGDRVKVRGAEVTVRRVEFSGSEVSYVVEDSDGNEWPGHESSLDLEPLDGSTGNEEQEQSGGQSEDGESPAPAGSNDQEPVSENDPREGLTDEQRDAFDFGIYTFESGEPRPEDEFGGKGFDHAKGRKPALPSAGVSNGDPDGNPAIAPASGKTGLERTSDQTGIAGQQQ